MRSWDTVVVGLGAMGSAALRSLAARGRRVLGIDRHEPPHEFGSSHGGSRVIRQAYFEHPDYVPLLRESYGLFARLERDGGEPLLFRVGGLFAGSPLSEVVAGSRLAAERHGIAHELIGPAEVTRRFPGVRIDPAAIALFEPGAGLVRPEATIRVALALARAAGAEVRTGLEVRGWRARPHALEVETSDGTIETGTLVVAAGSWSAPLLAPALRPARVALRVTRQPSVWVEPSPGPMPVWLVDLGGGRSVYGIPHPPELDPPGGPPAALKVALHGGGETVDPDRVRREVPDDEAEAIRAAALRIVPDAGAVVRRSTCLYTYSPDGHFVIDRDPADARVVLACGFSGHGFKFAPVVGEILADLAVDGRSARPAAFLGLDRFPLPA